MTTTCSYCGEQNLRWEEWPVGWRLVGGEHSAVHRCAEGRAAMSKANYVPQFPKPKKKAKSGAFLRCYGPRGGRTHAVLVETKIPDPDTPAGMHAELEKEDRKPQYYHLANRMQK